MKKIQNNLTCCLLITAIGCYTNTYAQQATARISTAEEGWQTITVPQAFRAQIGNDIGKLRIRNSKNIEVPYLVKIENAPEAMFKPAVYTKELHPADSTEVVLIDNKSKQEKQSYVFKIANTAAHKSYVIEGSDDKNTWFSLVSKGYLDNLYSEELTYTTKSISFPRTDYAFIRLTFDNKTSAPINILDIGEVETKIVRTAYEKLQKISFKQLLDKKNKATILSIKKDNLSPVDFIQLHISSTTPYHREAELYVQDDANSSKRKRVRYTPIREYLTLDLKNKEGFIVGNIPDAEFNIRIFNEDNPPLQIDSISLFQKPIQLIAHLQQNIVYTLQADSSRKTPNYDLNNAELKLPNSLPRATISNVQVASTDSSTKTNKYGTIILILCSVAGVIIVFYFGNSLLKDMKKQ